MSQKLFEQLKLNNLTIPNRIVFGSHRTNFSLNNLPVKRHVEYYEERAKGGVGLIILEEGVVHKSDYPYEKAIFPFLPATIERYEQIARAVHCYGTKIFARLNHWGSQGTGMIHRREIWGPSTFFAANELPKEMELADIQEVIAGFAQSAINLKKAGLDGVEINAGQQSLIRQFLSPLTNLRNDEYGGTLQNRNRFCHEVLDAVRRAVGSDFVVGLRLTMDEYAPWGGITPESGCELAEYLETVNNLDFFSISVGSIYSLHMTEPSMAIPAGYTLPYGQKLKQVTKLPVMVGGRINDYNLAVEALTDGKADLVELTRSLIADPQFPAKLGKKSVGQITPCIDCNQGCWIDGYDNRQLKCLVNYKAGREEENARERNYFQTVKTKRIAVVGGGPAGMTAAIQAKLAGHETHLFEEQTSLGGRLLLAQQVPGREGLAELIRYYERELDAAGVKLFLGWEVSEETDISSYQGVIIATGSKALITLIPGSFTGQVVSGEEVWQGVKVGERVLVIDEDGFHPATGLVELLAASNKSVYVTTSELFVGYKLTETGELPLWNQRVKRMPVTFFPHHKLKEAKEQSVILRERYSGVEKVIEALDTIVCCYPGLPREDVFLKLKQKHNRVVRIGDCVAPRTALAAIHEGYKAGRRI
ncbi:MAG: FAD-dependent oxidoreductase [Clostridia bacterium]|jgi:mycofactocin system FadH/OYE family oxidoreductase 2|nr:FAD-dependent oxidoreductase [Clostridia bacterium]